MPLFAFPPLAQCADSVFVGNAVRAVFALRFRHFNLQRLLKSALRSVIYLHSEKQKMLTYNCQKIA